MSLSSSFRLYNSPKSPSILSIDRPMAPPVRPQSSRSNSKRRQSQQQPQPSSSDTASPSTAGGSSSNAGQGNELLFLTYSNPAEFSTNRTNRRIVKKWASTTGLKNIRSQGSSQDEPPRSTPRSRSSKDPSPSTSKKRPSQSKQSASPAAASSGSSNVDPRVVTTSPSPSDATDPQQQQQQQQRDAQQDAQRIAYYRENYHPNQAYRLPERPARPTPAQADEIRRLLGHPVTGRVWSDPFDGPDSPVEESEYVGELILHYLRGDLMSEAWLEGEYEDVKGRLLPMRASFWFPLMLQSRAAYCAMLAFVESTPGIHRLGKTGECIQYHINLALRACTVELTDPTRLSSNPTVLAVILLMLTAQRMGDIKSMRTHARGLALLQGRRHDTRVPKQSNSSTWDPVWDTSPVALAMRGGPLAGMVPVLSGNPRSTCMRALQGPLETEGFDTLVATQVFGGVLAFFFHLSLILVGLSTKAGQDPFAATAVVQHCMLESLESLPRLNAPEAAAFQAIRLAQHACVRPIRSPDDLTTSTCVERAYLALQSGGLDKLREINRPDVLLWIVLAVGGYATLERRQWFGSVARSARQALGCGSAEAAITLLDEQFIWAAAMEGPLRSFWMEQVERGL